MKKYIERKYINIMIIISCRLGLIGTKYIFYSMSLIV